MELIWQIIIILLVFGLIVGIISSIAGIGGGVFFVGILTIFFLLPINEAIDTSTFIILISSGAAFITYLKEKRTNLKLSLIFAGFSILGSILCTLMLLFIHIDNTVLKYIFATVMLITGLNMVHKAIKSYKDSKNSTEDIEDKDFFLEEHDYKTNFKKSIPLFILAGFLANLLGIGGGVVNTPTLNVVLGYPILFTAIYNTIVKAIIGKINYLVGIIIGIGAVLGSILGAKVSSKMPKVTLQFFVAIILVALAISMYF
jgi:uncharacterized membrane protein YfcA